MVGHWNRDQDFNEGDYVHLQVRGDVWKVVQVADFHGYVAGEHMLTLEWVAGKIDPRRTCQFGSGQARKLNPMEVIALSAS